MDTLEAAREVAFVDGPDHTQLPYTDGKPVENSHELLQASLLLEVLTPVLQRLHPDGRYFVGGDCGIYWKVTNPPLDGCKSPDWYYVPGVPKTLDGEYRGSYVLYRELRVPEIVIEFVSGDGSEERDATPGTGKFWVYERGIRAPFYAIYELNPGRVELYALHAGLYRPVPANAAGRFPVWSMGVEFGIWQGEYRGFTAPWLRAWDGRGNLLPTDREHEAGALADARAVAAAERERALATERELAAAALAAERERAAAALTAEQQRAVAERERAAVAERAAEEARRQAGDARSEIDRLRERLRRAGLEP